MQRYLIPLNKVLFLGKIRTVGCLVVTEAFIKYQADEKEFIVLAF